MDFYFNEKDQPPPPAQPLVDSRDYPKRMKQFLFGRVSCPSFYLPSDCNADTRHRLRFDENIISWKININEFVLPFSIFLLFPFFPTGKRATGLMRENDDFLQADEELLREKRVYNSKQKEGRGSVLLV